MININSITTAIFNNIASNTTFTNSNITVELNTVYSTEVSRTPFVGLTLAGYDFEPNALGNITGDRAYLGVLSYEYYIQAGNHSRDKESFNDNAFELEGIKNMIITSVRSAISVSGFTNLTTIMLNGINSNPLNRDNTTNQDTLEDILTLNFEVRL